MRRDLNAMRNMGRRSVVDARNIYTPAVPTGLPKGGSPQTASRPRPKNSLPRQEAKRRQKFKQNLLRRYGTDERNRRHNLTIYQHHTEYGKIGSEGFRQYTTVRGIPYRRDRSPMNTYLGKRRQTPYQHEFEQSKKFKFEKWMGIFGNKRTVYSLGRKVILPDRVGGKT